MRIRLRILSLMLGSAIAAVCSGHIVCAGEDPKASMPKNVSEAKYLPYPNIWDWRAPDPERYLPGSLRTYLLDDGDVLIVYAQRKRTGAVGRTAVPKKDQTTGADREVANLYGKVTGSGAVVGDVESSQVTFFGGLTVLDEPSNVKLMRSADKQLTLSNGRKVRRLKSDWDDDGELRDKTYVFPSAYRLKDCYIGPARDTFFRAKSKNGPPPSYQREVIARKVIFVLLDKPADWRGAHYSECDEKDHKLTVRAEALTGRILPLDDGGFLVVDQEKGQVFRFNADFTTGSPLLNNKLFVFDFDDRTTNYLPYLFMPQFNGKKYTDKNDNIKMQEILDELYSYLIKIKGR